MTKRSRASRRRLTNAPCGSCSGSTFLPLVKIVHLVSALVLALAPIPSPAVEIIAHRGASYDAPENTLAALRLGYEQQADTDELDIHVSRDGQIVVIHDGDTKRTAGVEKLVEDQTLEELRQLDAGSFKDPRFAGEKIPTLAEALAIIPEGRRLFIEIKCGATVLPELERVLAASGRKPEQLVLISFKYDVLATAKKRLPQYLAYWIVGYGKDKKTGEHPKLEELLPRMKAANLDGLNLNAKFPIDEAFVKAAQEGGRKLYIWTVDDAAVARRLVQAGVDGIATNRPAWLREQLR
jgi:glycerophosphoryl diester phosphodiesterase